MGTLSSIAEAARRKASDTAFELRTLREAGVLGLIRPDKAARMGATFVRWGASPATGIAISAIEHPQETMVIDERGSLTFEQVHRRSNALARAFQQMGVRHGDGIGIMCRNHRGFIDATLASAKLGASALYLNTMFAGPQLAEVTRREGPKILVHDEEFTELLEGVDAGTQRIVAWTDGEPAAPTLDSLIAAGDESNLKPPPDTARFIILTSGTTGTPKGAQRSSPEGLMPIAALVDKIPYRSRETMLVAAPLFHSWGFVHFGAIGMLTSSTQVLRRRFDPEDTLRAVQEQRADVLVVVPVMIQRILQLPPEVLDRYDLSSLRITAISGSALPGELAIEWMDRFGDSIYNLYGSTEVAYATIATPEDLRAAPGTAGKPPRGTVVKLYDEEGREVPRGEVGRIFVGNEMAFEGYTGGGGKDVIGGLLSTGDVGHFDEGDRLFIDGRDDEMIVSGGENVFPREVEDLLADHDAVAEVAVIGVSDEEFGQRLKGFVVLAGGDLEIAPDDLRAHVKAHLAAYKVPREIEFLAELPRNATGKVLKRELHAREEQGEKQRSA
jgi:fatty-acyl-CoA synthase